MGFRNRGYKMEQGWVNYYPDYQARVFRNRDDIKTDLDKTIT